MFTIKTPQEVLALSREDYLSYVAEKEAHDISVVKEAVKNETEEANKNNATKEEIKSITEKYDNVLKQMDEGFVALKAMMESNKDNSNEAVKSELVKFIEKRSKLEHGTARQSERVEVKAAALMTTANVIPNATDGFNQLFGNYIDATIHSAPKQDTFILPLVDVTFQEGTQDIWYVQRINEEGDAAFIGEGDLKPLIDGEYKEYKAEVKEVAERWKISRRMMNNAPMAISNFRTHANELMDLKIDAGVLSGDGTGDELNGIATLAAPFVVPTALANYYEDTNIFDAIMAVATYVRLNNFKGGLRCVLNTVWEAKMKGLKNIDGDYIIPPFVSPDGMQVGSVRISFQNGMGEDDILLGDLKQFKVVMSQNVQYFEGYENDDFSKNLESRKLEAFLGTYLPSTKAGAIIYDDIATILTAISAT